MDANPEIIKLLQEILDRRCDRSLLARWLAESSLRFLESPNKFDRMIIADLDAALGEIQRGACGDEFLVETAELLVKGLGLILPDREIVIDMSNNYLDFITSSTNSGGYPMAQVQVEVVPSRA